MGQSLTANGGCEQNMHIHHALIPSQIWACYIPVVVIQNGWDNRLKTLEYWRESGKKFQCWILSAFKMRLIWSFFSAKGTKGIHDRSFSSHAVIYGILSGQLMSPMIYFMWLVVLSPLQTPHFRRLETGMQYSVQGQAKLQSLALFCWSMLKPGLKAAESRKREGPVK